MATRSRSRKRAITRREAKKLEQFVKGYSNHWRIRVLALLADKPELSVEEIAEGLGGNFKTISVHVRRMARAGLVLKRYEGRTVRHKLTDRAQNILTFLGKLE